MMGRCYRRWDEFRGIGIIEAFSPDFERKADHIDFKGRNLL